MNTVKTGEHPVEGGARSVQDPPLRQGLAAQASMSVSHVAPVQPAVQAQSNLHTRNTNPEITDKTGDTGTGTGTDRSSCNCLWRLRKRQSRRSE